MPSINDRLRMAAISGSEVELKALLRDPGCDPSSTSKGGRTALIWAAYHGSEACVKILIPVSNVLAKTDGGETALIWAASCGHESCVRLLLPVSDVLSKNKAGQTASDCARDSRHKSLARFIDAYVLAQSEQDSIGAAVCPGTPRKRAAPRV